MRLVVSWRVSQAPVEGGGRGMYAETGAHSEKMPETHPSPVAAFSLPAILVTPHHRSCVVCVFICTGQPPKPFFRHSTEKYGRTGASTATACYLSRQRAWQCGRSGPHCNLLVLPRPFLPAFRWSDAGGSRRHVPWTTQPFPLVPVTHAIAGYRESRGARGLSSPPPPLPSPPPHLGISVPSPRWQ